jgi:hypothetical protein
MQCSCASFGNACHHFQLLGGLTPQDHMCILTSGSQSYSMPIGAIHSCPTNATTNKSRNSDGGGTKRGWDLLQRVGSPARWSNDNDYSGACINACMFWLRAASLGSALPQTVSWCAESFQQDMRKPLLRLVQIVRLLVYVSTML